MNTGQHYRRLRKQGWRAQQAMHSARTYALADMIGEEYVRMRVMFDDDYLSWRDIEDEDTRRAHDEGVYGIIGEWFNPSTEQWQHADSVWGFIGDDWRDSGYDADCLQAAIDAYLKHARIVAAMLTSEGVGL